MADVNDLCSNHWEWPFSLEELRKLGVCGDRVEGSNAATPYKQHELSQRLGAVKVRELVERAQAGESARSLARELGVASSALTRMLRAQGVEVSRRKLSDSETARLRAAYDRGATIAELEKSHGLSHGAVIRALHRAGTEMRPRAPRKVVK